MARLPDASRAAMTENHTRRSEIPLYAATASLTGVLTAIVLRLWDAARAVPFYYSSDALAVAAHFKTVLDRGWYEREPALAAPFGQVYHDFPQADNLHMAVVAVMNLVVDSWAVAMNGYYVLGFPLAALTAVWFFRLVGVSRGLSLVLAVLYALAPFHFDRNQTHLFLASYYAVPLAVGVVVRVMRGTSLWSRTPRLGPPLTTVAAMVLVASSSTYYGVFTAFLLGFAGLVAFWRDRSWRRLGGAIAAGAVLVVTMLVNMAPDILYQRGRDANPVIAHRQPAEAEFYGLKPAQLLLPWRHHRWHVLGELRERYDTTFPLPGESPALGLVAAGGFVVLLVVAIGALVRRGSDRDAAGDELADLSLLGLVAVGVSQIGGVATFVALFVTASLRGWNRMAIFVVCLSLAATGLALDRLVRWLQARRPEHARLRAAAPVVMAVALLAVGVVDQTSGYSVPDYAGVRVAYANTVAYVQAIERQLPAGAAIFQLPHRVFPETPPVNGVLDTDQLLPYLASTRTRWSAGGLKGRPQTDWPVRLVQKPVATLVPLLAIAGFSGISIDRRELGPAAPRVESDLVAVLQAGPTAASGDGRFAFWPITAIRDALAARLPASELDAVREATLLPPMVYAGPDFDAPSPAGERVLWRGRVPDPRLLIDNARSRAVNGHLTLSIESPTGAAAVEIRMPSRAPLVLDLTRPPATVEVDLLIPPGRSAIELRHVKGAEDRDEVMFNAFDVRLEDPVLEGFRR